MRPESDEPPDDDDAPPDPNEDEGDDEEGADEPPLQPPAKPAPHELPDIMLMEGHARQLDTASILEAFSEKTAEFIRTSRAGFAVRLHGSGVHEDFIDAVVFASVLEPLARAARWVGGTVTGQRGVDPGLNAAFAGASLIVHFTMAQNEKAAQVEKDKRLAPTVGAGLYLAGLSGITANEERLLNAVDPLGTWGVNRYAQTLNQLAENNLSIDWLTKDERYVRATAGEALQGYRVLHSVPKMTRREVSVTGRLETASANSRRFRLETKDGGAISGTFLPSAEESLDGAWNHQVTATVRIEEPEQKNLPRSPRPIYTLLEVTHISPRRSRHEPR